MQPRRRRYRTYRADERPDVLVALDDGHEAKESSAHGNAGPTAGSGRWQWRRGPGQGTSTGDFTADRVRADDRDLTPPGWSATATPPGRE